MTFSRSEIRFAADCMLGRLARMLRLLGYDTLYSPAATADQLREVARRDGRVVLTRRHIEKRFSGVEKVFSVTSENAPQQLREVIGHYQLETRGNLWTRCTLCNEAIEQVEKSAVAPLVEPKVFGLYQEFFRCTGCGHVYWRGSHVERILKNLESILGGH